MRKHRAFFVPVRGVLAHVRSASWSDVVQRTNTDRYGLKRTITDSGSPIVFMSANAAWSVLPRVRLVRPVRHVRLNLPNQRRTITDDKPPIVFMSADAAWSVLPRVRHVRPVRLVRLNRPNQQLFIIKCLKITDIGVILYKMSNTERYFYQ
jgi:hypothetical protein